MKNFQFLLMAIVVVSTACSQQKATNNCHTSPGYTSYVNPLMGTDSEFSLSNGNTYPAIARPWGMNFWTPTTANFGGDWTYKYRDYKIKGLKQTHQPSPCVNDYAAFALMALTRNSDLSHHGMPPQGIRA